MLFLTIFTLVANIALASNENSAGRSDKTVVSPVEECSCSLRKQHQVKMRLQKKNNAAEKPKSE